MVRRFPNAVAFPWPTERLRIHNIRIYIRVWHLLWAGALRGGGVLLHVLAGA